MMSVKIDFSVTLDEQGHAEITVKITDLYASPPPVAPEFEFDYDYDPTKHEPAQQIAQTRNNAPGI